MFQRTRKPAFAIAFVTIRFSFLSSQSYSKLRIVSQSLLNVFLGIFLKILKFFRQSSQVAKSHRNCPDEKICRADSAEKSKLSWQGFCFVELAFLSGKVFNERKMLQYYVCLSVVCCDFLNLMVTVTLWQVRE